MTERQRTHGHDFGLPCHPACPQFFEPDEPVDQTPDGAGQPGRSRAAEGGTTSSGPAPSGWTPLELELAALLLEVTDELPFVEDNVCDNCGRFDPTGLWTSQMANGPMIFLFGRCDDCAPEHVQHQEKS